MNTKLICVIFYLALILFEGIGFAYDDKLTHPALTGKAIEFSNLDFFLYSRLGFDYGTDTAFPSGSENTTAYLLKHGSDVEDTPLCRASTHFHNPLRSWDNAGASEWLQTWGCSSYNSPNPGTQYSALVWATGYESYGGPIVDRNNQTMGWDKARDYFYSALTSPMSTDREENFANTFQAVGQVMHFGRIWQSRLM